VSFLLWIAPAGRSFHKAFPSPGGDGCHFYFGLLLLAGAFMRRKAFPSPDGDGCHFYFGLLLLAGAFIRRFRPLAGIGVISTQAHRYPHGTGAARVSVPWRGLVSFLRDLSGSVEDGESNSFQSPGGDWCHFYRRRHDDCQCLVVPRGFQSPGGDWCHFYYMAIVRTKRTEYKSFSPLAGIGVISTCYQPTS
jgi:hypothetical protein